MRLRPARQDVHIGLDVSPGRLKLVALAAGAPGPVVVFAADHVLDTPAGPERPRFDAARIGAEAAGLLARHRLRARGVALCLGPAEAVARRLVIVDQEPDQVLAALALQLGPALGADVAAPRVDAVPLSAAAPPGRRVVLAAAARPEAAAAHQRAVAAAGWEQGPVTAAAAGLLNAWRAVTPPDVGDRTIVLLHVGHTAALWMVVDAGEPQAMDAPLVGFASVLDRMGSRADPGAERPLVPAALLDEWAGRLRQEIARGLQAVRRDGGRDAGEEYEIWATGGGTNVPGFLDALGRAAGVRVRAYDPVGTLPTDPERKEGAWTGPALAPALGAALQARAAAEQLTDPLFALDLRAAADPRGTSAGRVSLVALVRQVVRDPAYRGLAAATLLLWATTAFLDARIEATGGALRAREARVATDSAAVSASMSRVRLLESRRAAVGEQGKAVRALEQGRFAVPRLLHGVSAAVPGPAWVSDVLVDGEDPATGDASFRVLGYAASEGVAGAFARALVARGTAEHAEVTRTTAVRIGHTPLVQFEVSGLTAAGAEPLEAAPATPGARP